MNDWQSTHLGRGALPRDLSGFEIEAFFTYSESERRVIDDERRSSALKLALALQIGFLRMTGRLLEVSFFPNYDNGRSYKSITWILR